MLRVTTLGKFRVTDGKNMADDEKLRSIMLSRLFIYILLYRSKTLTTENIASAIWQEEETDNPAGALKNLIYRLRKSLSNLFGNEDFILTNRGSYRWNPEVEVQIDCEEFEKLINLAKKQADKQQAIRYFESALSLYQGDFMGKLTDMYWVLTLSTYYHSLYLSAVKELAEIYLDQERYESLENLCTEALKSECADEELYTYQIRARIGCGKTKLAMDSYEKTKKILEKELGVRATPLLDSVYLELMSVPKGKTTYDIEEVKEDIEEEKQSGAFFCGYPVFKEIYHLEVRKSIRSTDPENLLLITVEAPESATEEIARYRIRQAMGAIEEIMSECLRAGDVTTRYSDSQFILLLPNCTKEHAMQVAKRIISSLYQRNPKYSKINFKVNIEQVSQIEEQAD